MKNNSAFKLFSIKQNELEILQQDEASNSIFFQQENQSKL